MGSRRDRRARSLTRLALTAFAVAACGPEAVAPGEGEWPPPPPSSVAGTVVHVIDGDSLRAEIEGAVVEVRLAGVNAPERDECHAARSREALRELEGASVRLDRAGRDQYGRTIAAVWSDSEFVNGFLVAGGHALALSDSSRWSASLRRAERDAREAGRGLWSPSACGRSEDVDLSVEVTTPDPPGDDNRALDAEVVTIRNHAQGTVDLSGYVLRDESSVNRLEFAAGTVLPAGGALPVSTGCWPPPGGVGWCSDVAVWNNGGDSALLVAPSGNIVAHDRYTPSG